MTTTRTAREVPPSGSTCTPGSVGHGTPELPLRARTLGETEIITRRSARRAKDPFSIRHGKNGLHGQPDKGELDPLPDLPLLRLPVSWVTRARRRASPGVPLPTLHQKRVED